MTTELSNTHWLDGLSSIPCQLVASTWLPRDALLQLLTGHRRSRWDLSPWETEPGNQPSFCPVSVPILHTPSPSFSTSGKPELETLCNASPVERGLCAWLSYLLPFVSQTQPLESARRKIIFPFFPCSSPCSLQQKHRKCTSILLFILIANWSLEHLWPKCRHLVQWKSQFTSGEATQYQ